MSLRTTMHAIICTSWLTLALGKTPAAVAEWKVDFSRRSKEVRGPAAVSNVSDQAGVEPQSFLKNLVSVSTATSQDIVILLTDQGFVPRNVQVKQGDTYRIFVVNVNAGEKNVSFVMDAFSEHHATYYGQLRSFAIRPQQAGVYSFFSPETSAQGRLVVVPAAGSAPAVEVRTPAGS